MADPITILDFITFFSEGTEDPAGEYNVRLSTATPSSIGTANAEGNSTSLARSGHIHDGTTSEKKILNLTDATTLTIATGLITRTQSHHVIDTEAAASSDNLAGINGGQFGDILILQSIHSARNIVVKHFDTSEATTGQQIFLAGGVDITLDFVGDLIMLVYLSNYWWEIGTRVAAAALHSHGPSQHITGTAWRFTYQNASGHETEIVLGANGTFLESNGASAAPAFRAVVAADLSDFAATALAAAKAGAGISDDDLVQVDGPGAGAPASGEYAKWTASGVEGKSIAEVLSDLAHSIADHDDTTATGTELETLTDGSDASALHSHDDQVSPVRLIIEDPTASEDLPWYTDKAITVKQINDKIIGTTSVTWNIIWHANGDTAVGSCSKLWNADRLTNSTSGAETSTFDDATIPAGSWVRFISTARVDTPDQLSMTMHFTYD